MRSKQEMINKANIIKSLMLPNKLYTARMLRVLINTCESKIKISYNEILIIMKYARDYNILYADRIQNQNFCYWKGEK